MTSTRNLKGPPKLPACCHWQRTSLGWHSSAHRLQIFIEIWLGALGHMRSTQVRPESFLISCQKYPFLTGNELSPCETVVFRALMPTYARALMATSKFVFTCFPASAVYFDTEPKKTTSGAAMQRRPQNRPRGLAGWHRPAQKPHVFICFYHFLALNSRRELGRGCFSALKGL